MIRVDYLQSFLKAYAFLVDCKLNCFYDSARMHYEDAIKALDSAYTSGQISWDTYKGYFASVSDSYSDCLV